MSCKCMVANQQLTNAHPWLTQVAAPTNLGVRSSNLFGRAIKSNAYVKTPFEATKLKRFFKRLSLREELRMGRQWVGMIG